MSSHRMMVVDEDFQGFAVGMFSAEVGPLTEYHFLEEAAPKKGWAVACFSTSDRGASWEVRAEDGRRSMWQLAENAFVHTHPMLATGDIHWRDYEVRLTFRPMTKGRCGLVFRYLNNRCYSFFGFDREGLTLISVHHERDFHVPDERILAAQQCEWSPGNLYTLRVAVEGASITAEAEGIGTLRADDGTRRHGKIALLSDVFASFHQVQVTLADVQREGLRKEAADRERVLEALRERYPKPRLWKRFETPGFGTGRNLRFGDLDGDGRLEIVVGQVVAHGPRDSYSEVGCLTALDLNGNLLWQNGVPDPKNHRLTNDVAFQVHDIDGDGAAEVVYARNFEMIVADGATGRTRYAAPTPKSRPPADRYERILGDCIYFADFRGSGAPRDIVIKDRYWNFWVFDEEFRPLWEGSCQTGHYPFALDIDGDGRDELAIGYRLYDHDGTEFWSLEGMLQDHADGIAIVDFGEEAGSALKVLYAASDEGLLFADLSGRILRHHRIGHAQNPTIAHLRGDLPGLQAASINFWGNQGLLHFYDGSGAIYHSVEPINMGSMCLPVNWSGDGTELFVLSPHPVHGGMYDGWGRQVVRFPEDGHPNLCNAVVDLTGDCRDEVVVWNQDEMWIYTQDDSPRPGRLYRPLRNPLYNQSNYQANISLPGWNDEG